MKRASLLPVLPILAVLAAAAPATADPRMETTGNFCHFILDPVNTDNEVFAAGCDSAIATVELPPPPGTAVACENVVARGYGERVEVLPQAAVGLPAGTTLTLSSADSEVACTMVESNGRAYRSYNWRSMIRVEATRRPGLVRVRYSLLCLDGRL